MKELGRLLFVVTLLCVLAATAEATTRTISKRPKGMVGVCADFDKRFTRTAFRFCAKQDPVKGDVLYSFSVEVITPFSEEEVVDNKLNVTQMISKRTVSFEFEDSSEVKVGDAYIKIYLLEVPQVLIKHLRTGIPIDVSFTLVKGGLREYHFTPEERGQIRMVALFEPL